MADPGDLRDLGFYPLPAIDVTTSLAWTQALLADAGLTPEDHVRAGPLPGTPGAVCVWAVAWLAADLYGTLQPPEWGSVARWRWLHSPPQVTLLRTLEDLFALGGPAAVRVYWTETLDRFSKAVGGC